MLLADDWLVGLLKGLIRKEPKPLATARHHLRNAWRIWKGLFMGGWLLTLSRLTWELPQTLLGLLCAHIVNWIRPVRNVIYIDGSTVLEGGGIKGSISFGTYILLYPGNTAAIGRTLFMHEYGHTLQSRRSGPLYLLIYGIPSILTPNDAWMERDANRRAAAYFRDKYGVGMEKHFQ
jgi:hypothetical protein